MEPSIIIFGVFGIMMFLLAFMVPGGLLILAGSSKPNGLIGFRTKRAFMSKENWEYANKRAGRLFIKCGIFYLAIMTMALFLIIYMELEKVVHEIYVIVPVILPIFLIGYIIYKVQKELKIRNT